MTKTKTMSCNGNNPDTQKKRFLPSGRNRTPAPTVNCVERSVTAGLSLHDTGRGGCAFGVIYPYAHRRFRQLLERAEKSERAPQKCDDQVRREIRHDLKRHG